MLVKSQDDIQKMKLLIKKVLIFLGSGVTYFARVLSILGLPVFHLFYLGIIVSQPTGNTQLGHIILNGLVETIEL